jgi:hypothetical protein
MLPALGQSNNSDDQGDRLGKEGAYESPADLCDEPIRRADFAAHRREFRRHPAEAVVDAAVDRVEAPINGLEPLLYACDRVVQAFVRPRRAFHESVRPQGPGFAPGAPAP